MYLFYIVRPGDSRNSCMNMNYNYRATIFRSIFAKNVQICGGKYIFTIFANELFKVEMKNCK